SSISAIAQVLSKKEASAATGPGAGGGNWGASRTSGLAEAAGGASYSAGFTIAASGIECVAGEVHKDIFHAARAARHLALQLVRRAERGDAAAAHYGYARGQVFGLLHVMRGQEER